MPEQVTKLTLFVASPGDVAKERTALGEVAEELNRTVASSRNLVIEVVRWETHAHPGLGSDPQEVINRQIGPADIFIGILWNRIGTPTPRAVSGTIEEFERARDQWLQDNRRHVFLYFKDAPAVLKTAEEVDQRGKVLEFRKSVEGMALIKRFRSVPGFVKLVRAISRRFCWHGLVAS
jgi:hypothetical protein